jgi:hypothetical protein
MIYYIRISSYILRVKVYILNFALVLIFDLISCLNLYHNYESLLIPYIP